MKLSVILAYCRASNWFLAIITLLFYMSMSGASVASNFWLADWSNAEGNFHFNETDNVTTFTRMTACDNIDGPDL